MQIVINTNARTNNTITDTPSPETLIQQMPGVVADWLTPGFKQDKIGLDGKEITQISSMRQPGPTLDWISTTRKAKLFLPPRGVRAINLDFRGATEENRALYRWNPNATVQPQYSSAFSAVFYFQTAATQEQAIFGATDSSTARCTVWLRADGVMRFLFGSAASDFIDAPGTFGRTNWHLGIVTFDGTDTIKASLDGGPFAERTGITAPTISNPLVVGDSTFNAEQLFFQGLLRRFMWFDRDISTSDDDLTAFKELFNWGLGGTLQA